MSPPESQTLAQSVAPQLKWYERLNVLSLTMAIFLILAVVSAPVLRGSGRDVAVLERVSDLADRMFPPDTSVTRDAFTALLETGRIAVWATLFAVLLALPLGIAASSNISPRWLVVCVRMLMNWIRTVPSIVWAMFGVAVVGPNSLAGVIGLTFYSLGYLVKFFSDAIESVDMKIADGLRLMGANSIQAFQHGVWPHARPLLWSSALFMFEYNIRSSAIIGLVGAGGIGVLIHSYWEYGQLDKFCMVLVMLLVPVSVLDLLGNWARQRMTRRQTMASS